MTETKDQIIDRLKALCEVKSCEVRELEAYILEESGKSLQFSGEFVCLETENDRLKVELNKIKDLVSIQVWVDKNITGSQADKYNSREMIRDYVIQMTLESEAKQ